MPNTNERLDKLEELVFLGNGKDGLTLRVAQIETWIESQEAMRAEDSTFRAKMYQALENMGKEQARAAGAAESAAKAAASALEKKDHKIQWWQWAMGLFAAFATVVGGMFIGHVMGWIH